MITIRRILCPIDFSEPSRHAFDHAVAIARAFGATVTALHAVPPVPPPIAAIESLYPAIALAAVDDLAEFRRDVDAFVAPENGGVPVESVAVGGYAAQEIVEMAQQLPADLLVMGTHGRSGFDRLVMGSVTEKVLRWAPCPVLTVPPRVPDAVPFAPALFSRILCAVDFTPSSLKALEYAGSLVGKSTARLRLVHVHEPASVFEPVMADASGAGVVDDRQALEAAHHRLGDLARSVPRAVGEVVASGKPYREILRLAAEQQSDLIVIGVHGGRPGLPAFGSTTNQVVRQATCPVLSLRA